MITPTGTVVLPGSAFVVRGSALVGPTVTLTGPAALTLTATEIAPHVLRFVLPESAAPGRYDVAASYRGTPGSIGTIEVSAIAPPLAAPAAAPAGTLAHVETPGRWSPNHDVTLTLGSPAPRGVAVVFDWTIGGGHFGSVAWVHAQSTEAQLGGSGHCGGYPFGATLPTRGSTVRATFVDERGQVGPWATLTVR